MTTDITPPRPGPLPTTIGQATAVEQSRAVAEVQAAVYVAQSMPRNLAAAEAEMIDSCGRTAMATRAFYAVPRGGSGTVNGPSVHLARELARIFGNVQYGVHELRRDDVAGESEIQAFAWDLQSNVRSTRTFIVPHQRMVKKQRVPLVDLNDVYLSNQNIGARAVRECIFTILPTWFTEAAQDVCRRTLERGDGVPLAERLDNMLSRFATIDVRVDQLERKLGKKRGAWSAGDLAQAAIWWTSITRDGIDQAELFPPETQTNAAEILGTAQPAVESDNARQLRAQADQSWAPQPEQAS